MEATPDVLGLPSAGLPCFVEERVGGHARRAAEVWRTRSLYHAPPAGDAPIELHTNDYLGLARHPTILAARVQALREQGSGLMMSAVFLDGASPQRAFERAAAEHLGFEDTILCQSGWEANIGLLQSLASRDVPVYLDRIAHASLWVGAELAGAPRLAFRHNDPDHLADLMRSHGPGVVVVDSVYSTDGSVCPLAALAEVTDRGGSALVVDESHSLGTHGPQGAGWVAQQGLTQAVHFVTASLSKAFCTRAGLVACPARFVDYFRLESRPAIFSSAVLPHEAVGLLATLAVVRSEGWRRERLHANASALRRGLSALGYDVSSGTAQIIALECGSEALSLYVRDLLAERGVVAAPFFPPATARDRALVRLSVNAGLDAAQRARALAACAAIRDLACVDHWPSSLRRRPLRARGAGAAARVEAA
jgi:CAI-1 autoinducer synthase